MKVLAARTIISPIHQSAANTERRLAHAEAGLAKPGQHVRAVTSFEDFLKAEMARGPQKS